MFFQIYLLKYINERKITTIDITFEYLLHSQIIMSYFFSTEW